MSASQTPSGLATGAATAPGGYATYRPRLPWAWWRRNPRYAVYMLRELSSVFIAIWAALFLAQLNTLRQGREEYDDFVAAQRRPAWLAFNVVTFLFALLHAVTWFQLSGVVLSGMAQKVRVAGVRPTPQMLTSGNFAGWAAASLGILLGLLLGGQKE